MKDAVEELIWEARRLFRAAALAADDALAPLGIDASARALLEFLAREPEPISISDLARKRNVSRQHVQQSLMRLPGSNWVTRQASPTNSKIVLLSLSPEGRRFWERVRKQDAELLANVRLPCTSSDLRKAAKTIAIVREALEGRVR